LGGCCAGGRKDPIVLARPSKKPRAIAAQLGPSPASSGIRDQDARLGEDRRHQDDGDRERDFETTNRANGSLTSSSRTSAAASEEPQVHVHHQKQLQEQQAP